MTPRRHGHRSRAPRPPSHARAQSVGSGTLRRQLASRPWRLSSASRCSVRSRSLVGVTISSSSPTFGDAPGRRARTAVWSRDHQGDHGVARQPELADLHPGGAGSSPAPAPAACLRRSCAAARPSHLDLAGSAPGRPVRACGSRKGRVGACRPVKMMTKMSATSNRCSAFGTPMGSGAVGHDDRHGAPQTGPGQEQLFLERHPERGRSGQEDRGGPGDQGEGQNRPPGRSAPRGSSAAPGHRPTGPASRTARSGDPAGALHERAGGPAVRRLGVAGRRRAAYTAANPQQYRSAVTPYVEDDPDHGREGVEPGGGQRDRRSTWTPTQPSRTPRPSPAASSNRTSPPEQRGGVLAVPVRRGQGGQ